MQNLNTSPVAQVLMADSKKFECDFSEGDALVIPNSEIAYGKPLFRVTESKIFLLSTEGKIWDKYDMPEDGDVVAYIETLLSSIGL